MPYTTAPRHQSCPKPPKANLKSIRVWGVRDECRDRQYGTEMTRACGGLIPQASLCARRRGHSFSEIVQQQVHSPCMALPLVRDDMESARQARQLRRWGDQNARAEQVIHDTAREAGDAEPAGRSALDRLGVAELDPRAQVMQVRNQQLVDNLSRAGAGFAKQPRRRAQCLDGDLSVRARAKSGRWPRNDHEFIVAPRQDFQVRLVARSFDQAEIELNAATLAAIAAVLAIVTWICQPRRVGSARLSRNPASKSGNR